MIRFAPTASLRLRLSVYLMAGLLLLWLAVAAVSATAVLHEINEAEDERMNQLARTLLQIAPHLDNTPAPSANIARIRTDGHTGFIVWHPDRSVLAADEHGLRIPYHSQSGFQDSHPLWQRNAWRYLHLHNADNGYTVAVAQQWHERLAGLYNALWIQLGLSLLLPLLFHLIHSGIKHGLKPLQTLNRELSERGAGSLKAVSDQVPAELQASVRAVNALLERIRAARAREQRFTADAAHELRSPLSALKVQADVLALSQNADEQAHHLTQIHHSLDRAQRLIDQLLALSQLDTLAQLPDLEPLDWPCLARELLAGINLNAREKRIRLKLELAETVRPTHGNPLLLQLMLRNLLDNAIRYSPENSQVTLSLDADAIRVTDQGAGIAEQHLPRIRERFYRPAGQSESGSGLGLAIVESVAALHGLQLAMFHTEHGFCVQLSAAPAADGYAALTVPTNLPETP